MNHRIILGALLALLTSTVLAQGRLEVKNISEPTDVYTGTGDEGGVKIVCHHSIALSFLSSMDKSAEPYNTELQGSDSIYYIAFPTGNRYRGRTLTINAKGYQPLTYYLDLEPKQLVTLVLTDPDALVDAGCYRTHRNQGMLEIKNMNYEEARDQFMVARQCSDVVKEENERNIALADSLIMLRQKGDAAYKLLEYPKASRYFMAILNLNPYDTYASNLNSLCVQNYRQECETLFSKAEFYFMEKDFDKAKELYERVIAKECNMTPQATERINYISSLQTAKKDHSRVFTYEYRKDVPVGFSYGKYNMHKAGGFFQMDINSTVLDAIRHDCVYGDEKFAEMNMAFGWTVKIASPVWIHFGPGFTGKMYYGTYAEDKYPTKGYGVNEGNQTLDKTEMGDDLRPRPLQELSKDEKKAWQKENFGFAVSPVIGLTVKYSFFALRLTYQYRWTVQSELEEFVGKSRLSAGIGIAF